MRAPPATRSNRLHGECTALEARRGEGGVGDDDGTWRAGRGIQVRTQDTAPSLRAPLRGLDTAPLLRGLRHCLRAHTTSFNTESRRAVHAETRRAGGT